VKRSVTRRSPDVYEFASPIHTTYPLWYDPYYWHEGVRVYPDTHGFVRTSAQSLKVYLRFFFFEEYAPALTVLLFLAALRGDCLAIFRQLLKHWPLLLVAVCALGMFGLILVEPRYVAGYLCDCASRGLENPLGPFGSGRRYSLAALHSAAQSHPNVFFKKNEATADAFRQKISWDGRETFA
jgi:hypothetical protein